MAQLSMAPQDAANILLKKLPHPRMRDVLEKRFGLKGGAHTLEAIGKKYKITRERVRQIEADAFRHLRKKEHVDLVRPIFESFESHIVRHGGVMAEPHLFGMLANTESEPYVTLLLETGSAFRRMPETDVFHPRWTVDAASADRAEKVVASVVRSLEETGHSVSEEELNTLIAGKIKAAGITTNEEVTASYLNLSKQIKKNPYGEYGLTSWSAVSPRGVRDKAYLALQRSGKALHFTEVAKAISQAGWSARKAHPQTVHNELIKDSRFVLVGRGLYALREWGYQPGVVRDVMVSVLKNASRPLSKDDIVKSVLEKRMVKPQTVILNLQNKSLFKRTDDEKYMLA